MIDLRSRRAILLDLDGTLYHEDRPVPGASELVAALQKAGRTFACLSNSTSSPSRISQRLARMGMNINPGHIYSAAAAAADYIFEHYPSAAPSEAAAESPPGSSSSAAETSPDRLPRIYNLATEGMRELLEGRVHWVESRDQPCDAVVAGAPANVYATLDRQRVALVLLRAGADLVGICADRVYPSHRGLEFGVGAHCAMLSYASGVQPIYVGKPQEVFFRELCHKLGVEPSQCLLVGDNVETDIAGGKRLGMLTILTLTGVTQRADLDGLAADHRPDAVVPDLHTLAQFPL